jgi:hypothetical protein
LKKIIELPKPFKRKWVNWQQFVKIDETVVQPFRLNRFSCLSGSGTRSEKRPRRFRDKGRECNEQRSFFWILSSFLFFCGRGIFAKVWKGWWVRGKKMRELGLGLLQIEGDLCGGLQDIVGRWEVLKKSGELIDGDSKS